MSIHHANIYPAGTAGKAKLLDDKRIRIRNMFCDYLP